MTGRQEWPGVDSEREADPLAELLASLGEQVRRRREELGWSRGVLTRYSGRSREWLGRCEDGVSVVSLAAVCRWASVMGSRVVITLVDIDESVPTRREQTGGERA
ncbi:helix-turn-helix domain-containing protein [Kutzneria sp. NPDC051319]|uniref:helix-turn-helix domain-containing protein n=1 Tax=Kutzneria sp. NPDC051319 TaxID=3155047 RepID=UPI0034259801